MTRFLMLMLAMGTLMTGVLVIKKKMSIDKPVTNWQWKDDWGVQIDTPVEKPKELEKPKAESMLVVGTYKEALKKSEELNRPIFAYFVSDACPWCQRMKSEVLDSEQAKSAMKKYIMVFINVDRNRDLARKYGVGALPFYAVLNHKEEMSNHATGYMDLQKFLNWLG